MKKLLELLATINLATIVTSNVIACDFEFDQTDPQDDLVEQIATNSQSTLIAPQKTFVNKKPDIEINPETNIEPKTDNIEDTHVEVQQDDPTQVTAIEGLEPQQVEIETTITSTDLTHESNPPSPIINTQIQNNPLIKVKLPPNITYFIKDNNNNDYFVTDNGLYVLRQQNGALVKIDNINNGNIWNIIFDSKNNMYFASYSADKPGSDDSGELYMIKNNTTIAVQIDGINQRVHNIAIDKHDNVYLTSANSLFVLKNQEQKIGIIQLTKKIFYQKTLGFDDQNNLYFTTSNETYVIRHGQTKSTKIAGLTGEINSIAFNQNKIYFATKKDGAYVLDRNDNTTTATKIAGLNHLAAEYNEAKYLLIDDQRIYVGCSYGTYILDFNHTIIKTLPFGSDLLEYDNQGNIYFGTGRGLYRFEIADVNKREVKIELNKNGSLTEIDDEIKRIYFINNQIYFQGYLRTHDSEIKNFYKITANDTAKIINLASIYS